jgi:hypothetical protein
MYDFRFIQFPLKGYGCLVTWHFLSRQLKSYFIYTSDFYNYWEQFYGIGRFQYPWSYFDFSDYVKVPYNTKKLFRVRRKQALWVAWGFYSRVKFNELTYRPELADLWEAFNFRFTLFPLHERRMRSSVRSQVFKISMAFNDNLKGRVFMKFIKHRLLNPRTIFHFKQMRYIVTTMNGNIYIGRQFAVPYIPSRGAAIFDVLDIAESLDKDVTLSFMLPLVNFTQIFPFFEIFLFAVAIIFCLYTISSTFKNYIKINSRYLYSYEALWALQRLDVKQQYIWYVGAIFFADVSNEVLQFYEEVDDYFFEHSSAWLAFTTKHSSWKKSWEWIMNYFASLNLSGVLTKEVIENDKWSQKQYDFVVSLKDRITAETELVFENIFPLHVFRLPKFKEIFINMENYVFNWDGFIFNPFRPAYIFSYYLELYNLFIKPYHLDFYLWRLFDNYIIEYTDIINLNQVFKIVYDASFTPNSWEINYSSFEGFEEVEVFLNNFAGSVKREQNLRFFSNYYYDFLSVVSWDKFEQSLIFYDPRTANMSKRFNIEVDEDDNLIEEDDIFQDIENYDYLYEEYLWQDVIFLLRNVNFEDLEVEVLEEARTIIPIVMWVINVNQVSWEDNLIEGREVEEKVPGYLLAERPEFDIWDYTEEIQYSHVVTNSYYFEDKLYKNFIAYLWWLDKNFFEYNLPWWSFHKDWFFIYLEPSEVVGGKEYWLKNDYNFFDVSPVFFYWIYSVLYCIGLMIITDHYLMLFGFMLIRIYMWVGLHINYVISSFFFFDSDFVKYYYDRTDREIAYLISYVVSPDFYQSMSWPLLLESERRVEFVSFFNYWFSCMIKFFKIGLVNSYFKIKWLLAFIVWLSIVLVVYKKISIVMNRFTFYNSGRLRWNKFVNYKVNLKIKFLYGFWN